MNVGVRCRGWTGWWCRRQSNPKTPIIRPIWHGSKPCSFSCYPKDHRLPCIKCSSRIIKYLDNIKCCNIKCNISSNKLYYCIPTPNLSATRSSLPCTIPAFSWAHYRTCFDWSGSLEYSQMALRWPAVRSLEHPW